MSDCSSEYWEWAAANGCLRSKIKVAEDPSKPELGRGVHAEEDLEELTEVLRVPLSMMMTVETALATDVLGDAIRECGTSLQHDNLLVLHLLHEKSKGEESRWFAHFKEQPKSYDQTVMWSDQELDEVAGTNLYTLTLHLKQQLLGDYTQLMENVVSKHPSLFPAGFFTFEEYMWGCCTLWSRAFDLLIGGEIKRCIVPVADMFNSSTDSNTSCVHGFDDATQSFRIVLQQAAKAGQEIFISYGAFGNGKLLRVYGYALHPNPSDTVEIYAPMDDSAPFYANRQRLLEDLSVNPNQGQPITNEGVSSALMGLLRVQRMEVRELADPDVIERLRTGKAVSVLNEIAVCRSLSAALEVMHESMRSTLEADEASVERWKKHPQTTPSLRHQHAVFLRIGEGRILRKAREYLDTRDERATSLFDRDGSVEELD